MRTDDSTINGPEEGKVGSLPPLQNGLALFDREIGIRRRVSGQEQGSRSRREEGQRQEDLVEVLFRDRCAQLVHESVDRPGQIAKLGAGDGMDCMRWLVVRDVAS